MDPVEEVAYRNRPPLLEDVSIRGPIRYPVKDAMETLEEREAIEADFRWYRWSKFAFPWLIWCLALSTTVLCLSLWQQIGGLKHFPAETVFTHGPFPSSVPWGVPRNLVKISETSSSREAGMRKSLRNVRIATVFHGAIGIFFAFFTLLVKPRPNIRKGVNFLWVILLLACCALAIVSFVMALADRGSAVQCPWNFERTHEKCIVRKGFVTIPLIADACIFLGAGLSALLLAYFNIKGDWKLLRTGYRERERDAELEQAKPQDKSMRKVRPVNITLLTLLLLWTAAAITILTIFIILVHLDYTHDWPVQSYRAGRVLANPAIGGVDNQITVLASRGKDVHERAGWAARNLVCGMGRASSPSAPCC